MNKRILFYYTQLNIGGAEKSLVRMMNALFRDGNEVTLLTRYGHGGSEKFLDAGIRRVALSEVPANSGCCGKIYVAVQRLWRTLKLRALNVHCDLVVTGLHGLSPEFVLKNVHSQRYMQCIRNDLMQITAKERVLGNLQKFQAQTDDYLCVSQTAFDSLVKLLPGIQEKAFVLYNFLDVPEMRKRITEAERPFENGTAFRMVSVCRVEDSSKGVFRMLNVARRLAESGYDFQWYLVGDGPDAEKLRNQIIARKAERYFIMVGRKENPFSYYKYADLVVVPSYHEGLCGVVNEAKIAGAAVLATEFSGIHEQLTHGENGWIVENSEEAIYAGLKTLLDNRVLLARIANADYPKEIIDDQAKLTALYRHLGWI